MNSRFRKLTRKKKQRTSSRNKPNDYQKLEPRCLLAVEVGLNFTGALGGVDTLETPPDTAGAVGPTHIVEMVNGRVTVYDKDTGVEAENQTLDQFWLDAGADLDFNTTSSPRVLYDPTAARWFATSLDQGTGNSVYVGVSSSSNPLGPWDSLKFVADTGGSQIATLGTLSVDANGVYITTNNTGFASDVSIFSIPKSDVLADDPTLLNITRFEGLDPDQYGTSVQIALDYASGSTRAIALGADADGGTTLFRTDLVGTFGPAAALAPVVSIDVPEYLPASGGRQPGGVPIDNISPDFSSSVIRRNGSLWAVHAVRGTFGNSAIRWYQIDEVTNELTNWGTLERADMDYLDPSISVSEFGTVAIGYTATGLTRFPSAEVVIGYTANGLNDPTIFWQDPATLRNGLADYEFSETSTNHWGRYSSTQVDPNDPFSFWTFQEYAVAEDQWAIRIAEAGAIDLNPTLRGDADNNVVIVRVSERNSDWVEVEIDGNVTDVFEKRGLTTLNIDALGGDDTLVLDYSNGDPNPNTGVTVRGGDGFDIVQVVGGTTGNTWVVDGDGRGFIDKNARFRTAEQIEGSGFADTFIFQEGPGFLNVFGGAGRDFFNVTKPVTGTLNLFGETGDDSYRLALENISGVTITDTIGSESDRLITVATEGDDVIDLDGTTLTLNGVVENGFDFPGIETLGIDALGGDDQFYIRQTLQAIDLFGADGQDQFFLSSAAPDVDGNLRGLFEELNIDGGFDRNRIVIGAGAESPLDVRVTDTTLEGFTDNGQGVINYVATGGSFAWNDGVAGLTIQGSTFGDKILVTSLLQENTLRINSGDGGDNIEIRPEVLGNVDLDGQGGSDFYRLTMLGDTSRIIRVPDSGGGDQDRIELNLSENDDVVRLAHGFIRHFSEQLVYGVPNEILILNTRGGNDIVELDENEQDYIRVNTGFGDDQINVVGSRGVKSFRLEMGAGNDVVNMQESSSLTFFGIVGQTGNDELNVSVESFGDIVFDGGEDADTANINNIGRTNRYISVRDSGNVGDDQTNIYGVETQDRYVLRPNSISNRKEVVAIDESNESLFVDAGAGNDIVEVFGTKADRTRVLTRTGNDLIFVRSTLEADLLFLDAGAGNDSVVVTGTTVGTWTSVFGQGGDDLFNVGSTAAADNGNLSQIRGGLRITGGASVVQDRLLVNDRGAMGTYGYYVGPSHVVNLSGGNHTPRPEFMGVRFDASMEYVRVDGTDQDNFFSVTPNDNAIIHIDGNDESFKGDTLLVLGSDQGQLFTTGPESGVWKFSNGPMDIRFEEIESVFGPNVQSSPQARLAGANDGPQLMQINGNRLLAGAQSAPGNQADRSDDDSVDRETDEAFEDLEVELLVI